MAKSGDLPLVRVQNPDFEAEILLQGAQLMHFAPRGQKGWIFRSANTPYAPADEIYGGVPVIFPWFGVLQDFPEAPNHGFLRQARWEVENAAPDGSSLTLGISDEEVRAQGFDTTLWPYQFEARLIFGFGETLDLRFEIQNMSAETVRFECSLHAYFAVENLQMVRVEGLDGEIFCRSQEPDEKQETQSGDIDFGATRGQMFRSSGLPLIRDENRAFHLAPREGWRSTIVWNPGHAMADLSEDDAKSFVCVEPGAIEPSAIALEPGQTYALDFCVDCVEEVRK